MALIKCEECGNEISENAKICPNCGAKNKIREKKDNIIIAVLVPLFLIIMLIGIFFLFLLTH